MSDEINLTQTFDARIWCDEWMKAIEKHPEIPTDEGTMHGWFANAIMAGYDHAERKHDAESDGMMTISKDAYAELLVILIARGDSLGFLYADDDYRQELQNLLDGGHLSPKVAERAIEMGL